MRLPLRSAFRPAFRPAFLALALLAAALAAAALLRTEPTTLRGPDAPEPARSRSIPPTSAPLAAPTWDPEVRSGLTIEAPASAPAEAFVGTVVDEAGAPVAGAEVVLVHHELEGGRHDFSRWRTHSTEDGRFAFTDATTEGSALEVSARGFLDAYVPVTPAAPFVVRLERDPARELRVDVHLPDGRAVSGAWLRSKGKRALTDSTGTTTIAHVAGETLEAWAFLPDERLAEPGGSIEGEPYPDPENGPTLDRAWSRSVVPAHGEDVVHLTLQPAPEVHVVLRAPSGPAPGRVFLRWSYGNVSEARVRSGDAQLDHREQRVLPTADGTFRFRRPGGKGVTLLVASRMVGPAWHPLSAPLFVPASESDVRVELELSERTPFTGRLVDSAGEPIAGARIRLKRTDGPPTSNGEDRSDPDGTVRFGSLSHGRYSWWAESDTHLFDFEGVAVHVPRDSGVWTAVGRPGGWIEVATHDAAGSAFDRAPQDLHGPEGRIRLRALPTGKALYDMDDDGPRRVLRPGERWRWGPLTPGAYTFTFDSGHGLDVHRAEVQAGVTTVVEVHARTAPKCVVRGRLEVDPHLDVTGLAVQLFDGVHVRARGRTDASGRFELESSTAGPMDLRVGGVKGPERWIVRAVELHLGLQELVPLEVPSGAVRGLTAPLAGMRSNSGLSVELCPEDGGRAHAMCRPNADAARGLLGFGLDGLAPGRYLLRLVETRSSERTVHREAPVVVEGGQVTRCWL